MSHMPDPAPRDVVPPTEQPPLRVGAVVDVTFGGAVIEDPGGAPIGMEQNITYRGLVVDEEGTIVGWIREDNEA